MIYAAMMFYLFIFFFFRQVCFRNDPVLAFPIMEVICVSLRWACLCLEHWWGLLHTAVG
jgi:hypothetical protein